MTFIDLRLSISPKGLSLSLAYADSYPRPPLGPAKQAQNYPGHLACLLILCRVFFLLFFLFFLNEISQFFPFENLVEGITFPSFLESSGMGRRRPFLEVALG